jgi:undecaprenyl diphosphate synthase
MAGIEEKTSASRNLTLTVAINYGGRDEIRRATRDISLAIEAGLLKPDQITDEVISQHLDTSGLPDPDLVIRTSGETRTSNFLPWQAAYAEYEFTDKLWPDFTPQDMAQILDRFGQRERRFGGVSAS